MRGRLSGLSVLSVLPVVRVLQGTLLVLVLAPVGLTPSGWTRVLAQTPQAPAAPPPAAAPATPAEPSKSAAKDSRYFEMRTYYAAPGKADALNARFRDHTSRLFQKHGMTIVGYWIPRDKPDVIVYILAYKDRAAREVAWKAFGSDPEWQSARKASEVDGRLAEKVESVFMDATDYSPLK